MVHKSVLKLGIPIDRVPTSKSCVFCIGMDSFFPTFDSFERIIFLKQRCYASIKVGRRVSPQSPVALRSCYIKV